MKKILVSLLLLSTIAIPASAASKMKKHNAGAGIDHSKDAAYSAQWADQAVSPAPGADFSIGSMAATRYVSGGTTYYGLSNFTLYGATAVNMNGVYLGMDAPSYDGAAKNIYRNMRAGNESEPLPSSDGK